MARVVLIQKQKDRTDSGRAKGSQLRALSPSFSQRALSLRAQQSCEVQTPALRDGRAARDGRAHLYLLGCQVLGAPEHVALGNPFTAQLMNLDHPAKSDEPHQGIRRQQAQGHLQGLLQGLQILLFQARVHNIQEDQRRLWTSLMWEEITFYKASSQGIKLAPS